LDPKGKDPLVGRSAEWARSESSDRHRSSERRRVKRRSRSGSAIRARIRVRVWLACIGALLVMLVGIYLALSGGSG
jgi:cell division septal protein FtsQ